MSSSFWSFKDNAGRRTVSYVVLRTVEIIDVGISVFYWRCKVWAQVRVRWVLSLLLRSKFTDLKACKYICFKREKYALMFFFYSWNSWGKWSFLFLRFSCLFYFALWNEYQGTSQFLSPFFLAKKYIIFPQHFKDSSFPFPFPLIGIDCLQRISKLLPWDP